jgi:hypothetical protein
LFQLEREDLQRLLGKGLKIGITGLPGAGKKVFSLYVRTLEPIALCAQASTLTRAGLAAGAQTVQRDAENQRSGKLRSRRLPRPGPGTGIPESDQMAIVKTVIREFLYLLAAFVLGLFLTPVSYPGSWLGYFLFTYGLWCKGWPISRESIWSNEKPVNPWISRCVGNIPAVIDNPILIMDIFKK